MKQADPQWLFIVCAARSGSKYLRGLLAASPEVAAVPFDVNFLWRRGQESRSDDALTGTPDTHIGDGIRRRLIELSRWSPTGRARIVVEKSVSNSLRVPYVASLFPEARFVHLVRDGRAVVESARRMWVKQPEPGRLLRKLAGLQIADWRYGLWFACGQLRYLRPGATALPVWGPRYPGIDQDLRRLDLTTICAKQWLECVSRASIALDAIPPERRFSIHYEDLVRSGHALPELCRLIGIADPAPVMAAHARDTVSDGIDGWRSRLTAADCFRIEAMAGEWLQRLGYTHGRERERVQ